MRFDPDQYRSSGLDLLSQIGNAAARGLDRIRIRDLLAMWCGPATSADGGPFREEARTQVRPAPTKAAPYRPSIHVVWVQVPII